MSRRRRNPSKRSLAVGGVVLAVGAGVLWWQRSKLFPKLFPPVGSAANPQVLRMYAGPVAPGSQ